MANNSFTFWSNMKETIDIYEGNPEYQYKLYDALTEYGLYGIWPEDDGTIESKNIISFVQSMVPSLEKSSNFTQKCAESGSAGGRKEKISTEQIENAIKLSTIELNKIPKRQDVVDKVKDIYGISLNVKTITRRYNDEKKKEFAERILEQNRDINNVPGTLGHNGDISHVPVCGTGFNF